MIDHGLHLKHLHLSVNNVAHQGLLRACPHDASVSPSSVIIIY